MARHRVRPLRPLDLTPTPELCQNGLGSAVGGRGRGGGGGEQWGAPSAPHPTACSGVAAIPGGGGRHPHDEREWGSGRMKLVGQFPKPQAGACRVTGSCSPPQGIPPTGSSTGPCWVTPLMAAPCHAPAQRGPSLRGIPHLGEVVGDRSHPISFPSLPPPLSSHSSPTAPRLSPPSRGVMPGSDWCDTRHNPTTAPSRYSRWKRAGASPRHALASRHGGAAGPPCTPRDGEMGGEEAQRPRKLLGMSKTLSGARRASDGHGSTTVTVFPAQPSHQRCPEPPRQLSHAENAALTACAHTPARSQPSYLNA